MRRAAFLRAINVGGRRLSNEQLRSHFETIGLREIGVFRASGNVVFAGGRESSARLTARIEDELARLLGYEVAVFLRTEDELRAIARHAPFASAILQRSTGKLQVGMLTRAPTRGVRAEVLGLRAAGDELAFGERELYWLPRAGMLDSALDMKGIETLLGPMTFRTKGTVEALVKRYLGDGGPSAGGVA